MSFNPGPNKQAQEVILSEKLNKPNCPSLNFNSMVVIQSTTHKHLGMIFDAKLDFQERLKDKPTKISKAIGLIRKLQKYYLDLHCLQYISHLLDATLIMATPYMTKHIIPHFIKT